MPFAYDAHNVETDLLHLLRQVANRPGDRGNNPLTATHRFLAEREDFAMAASWARRSLMSAFRDGVLAMTGQQAPK